MITKSGMANVFSHFPNGYMWTGNGDRSVKLWIDFTGPSFDSTPMVVVSLSAVDAGHETNLRVRSTVTKADVHGFEVEVATWADTHLALVDIAWTALAH